MVAQQIRPFNGPTGVVNTLVYNSVSSGLLLDDDLLAILFKLRVISFIQR